MLRILIALLVTPAHAEPGPSGTERVAAAIRAEGYRPHRHPRGRGAPIHVFACTRDAPCQRPAIAERDLPQPYHFDDRPRADVHWRTIDPADRPEP